MKSQRVIYEKKQNPPIQKVGINISMLVAAIVFAEPRLDRLCVSEHSVMHVFILTLTDNPLLSTKVSVTVNVLDVNEFAPELAVPSDTFVCENSRVGQVMLSCIHIAPTHHTACYFRALQL